MTSSYDSLQVAFSDVDKQATAQRYIQRLRQANRPFHQYLADFEAHIHDTWYDQAKQRFKFNEGLSIELRYLLIPTGASKMSFAELKTLCHRMDNEQRQLASIDTRFANPWAKIEPAIDQSTNNGNIVIDSSSMNSNPARASGSRGLITPQEGQRRLNNDFSLYAGCSGHVSQDCPFKKASEERKALLQSWPFGSTPTTKAPKNSDAGNGQDYPSQKTSEERKNLLQSKPFGCASPTKTTKASEEPKRLQQSSIFGPAPASKAFQASEEPKKALQTFTFGLAPASKTPEKYDAGNALSHGDVG